MAEKDQYCSSDNKDGIAYWPCNNSNWGCERIGNTDNCHVKTGFCYCISKDCACGEDIASEKLVCKDYDSDNP